MTASMLHLSFLTPTTVQSGALVPSNGALVTADRIASVAMDRLRFLQEQMEKDFVNCTNEKAKKLISQYETEMALVMKCTTARWQKNTALQEGKKRLFSEQTLAQMKQLIVVGDSLTVAAEKTFEEQINLIDQTFPEELETYIKTTIVQLESALNTKREACREQANFYLKQMNSLEKFLSQVSAVIPSYSLYGASSQSIVSQERAFNLEKTAVINQMQAIIQSEGLVAEIKSKVESTTKKIAANKQLAMQSLQQALSKRLSSLTSADAKTSSLSLDATAQRLKLLKEASSIYLEESQHYLSLVSVSVNELVAGVQDSIAVMMAAQDGQWLHLTKKSKALSDFLEHQTQAVLKLSQAQQKPVQSKEIGQSDRGATFNDQIAEGRICELKIRAGWIIDALQVGYADHTEVVKWGPQHGGVGGREYRIKLAPDEKIVKVILGTDAFKGTNWNINVGTVEELTLYSNKGKQYGPYGGRGDSQGHQWLKDNNRLAQMQMHTIEYGPNYYLGAIKGRADTFVHALSFIFFRDFSQELVPSVTKRMAAVVTLLNDPSTVLSEEEKQKIRHSFAQVAYVDLSQDEDFYAVLGISADADQNEIERAHRRLLAQYHPDKVPIEEQYKLPLYQLKREQVERAYKALS